MPRNAPSARPRASATLKRRRASVMTIASSTHRIGTHDPAAMPPAELPPLTHISASRYPVSLNQRVPGSESWCAHQLNQTLRGMLGAQSSQILALGRAWEDRAEPAFQADAAEQADQCRGRLLRARGERPSRCAAEDRDEIAPPHLDGHASGS